MELVRAGFGDGVDHSPGGAAVFRGIVRSVYLKLLHGRLGDGVPDARATTLFGKERLVVVAAVYSRVVEKRTHASETDQPKTAGIIDRAGCEKRET